MNPKREGREWTITVCDECGTDTNYPCPHQGPGRGKWHEVRVVEASRLEKAEAEAAEAREEREALIETAKRFDDRAARAEARETRLREAGSALLQQFDELRGAIQSVLPKITAPVDEPSAWDTDQLTLLHALDATTTLEAQRARAALSNPPTGERDV